MMKTDILFANSVVGMWHHKHMISQLQMKSMINAETIGEAIQILLECDYDCTTNAVNENVIIEKERARTFDRFKELCNDNALLDCVLAKYNYHNAKVLFWHQMSNTSIKKEALYPFAIKKLDIDKLPQTLKEALAMITNDITLSELDNIIEVAYYKHLAVISKKIKSKSIRDYYQVMIDLMNIRTAYKCRERGREFDNTLFFIGGRLSQKELAPIITSSAKTLSKELNNFHYRYVIDALVLSIQKHSYNYLDEACDEHLLRILDATKDNTFAVNPLFYWYVIKQEELKIVKAILMGKRLNMSSYEITKNLRGHYGRFK